MTTRRWEMADLKGTVNLVVPYQEPTVKGDVTDFSSTLSSTLPMAAMFMRNKFVGWYGLLGYPGERRNNSGLTCGLGLR